MNQKWKQLNQKNSNREKQITAENEKIYTPIIIYLRGSHIPEYEQECIRQDLIDMTLSAQERNESLKTIINGDYKQFCDEIIATFKPNKRNQFLDFLSILCHSFFFNGLISIIVSPKTIPLIEKIVNEKAFDFRYTLPVSVATIVTFILIISAAFFITYFITKNAFKNKWTLIVISSIFIGIIFTAIILAYLFFGKIILFNINILIAFFTVIMFYVLTKIIDFHNK